MEHPRVGRATFISRRRLTSSTVSGQPAVNYGYSPNGNLVTKGSDTLSYTNYRVTGATIKGGSRSYSYDNAGHVLSDGKRTYQWTSFGQLKEVYQASTPQLETFAATGTFGTEIVGIAPWVQYQQSQAKATFEFDAGGSRSRQTMLRTFADASEASVITRYLGSYELEEHATKTAGGTVVPVKTLHRHSLGSVLLTEECPWTTPRGTTASKVRLGVVLTDHIGSTELIVRAEWDHSNATWQVASGEMEAERQSFNAWGERRNAATWAALKTAHNGTHHSSGADYDRGFTGHEMLDDFGIIHMNGRIYDPELGRFLSADPYVQVPEYSQNFNRYSYVLNNPLSYTDSSGHFIDLIIGVVVGIVATFGAAGSTLAAAGALLMSGNLVAAAVTALQGIAILFGAGITAGGFSGAFGVGVLAGQGFVAGAFMGAASAAVTGGDVLRGALIGAVSGAITAGALGGLEHGVIPSTGSGAGDYALHKVGHGIVGGATNEAMGGKFGDGFISSAVSAIAAGPINSAVAETFGTNTIYQRTAIAAVVGGTTSAIGGGKFANGAATAAFQHLLNAEIGKNAERKITHELEGYAQFTSKDANGKGADLVFASSMQDSIFSAVPHIEPSEFYTVAGHGTESGKNIMATVNVHKNGVPTAFTKTKYISAESLARAIRFDPNWKGRDVRLVVCNSGFHETDGIAAKLAKELKVNVSAPTGIVSWSAKQGWSLRNNDFQRARPLEWDYFRGRP